MTQPVVNPQPQPKPPTQTADYLVFYHDGVVLTSVKVPGVSKVFVENDVLYFNNAAGDTEAIFYVWQYVQRG